MKSNKKFALDWKDNARSSGEFSRPFGPLRQYRIKFVKESKGAQAGPNPGKPGMRSKLGGAPDWLQAPNVPRCRACRQSMTFVAQINSMEHDEPHNPHAVSCLAGQPHFMFGDVGMIYVFMCFGCMATKSIVQYG